MRISIVKINALVPGQDDPNFRGVVLAEREDGVKFGVIVPLDITGLTPEARRLIQLGWTLLHQGIAQLNEYGDCTCQFDAPCERHKGIFNPFEFKSRDQT